jgi:hypothetical protein
MIHVMWFILGRIQLKHFLVYNHVLIIHQSLVYPDVTSDSSLLFRFIIGYGGSSCLLCPNRRVTYTTPLSSSLNITYHHDYIDGDCCNYPTTPSCNYSNPALLERATAKLGQLEDIWVHDADGRFFTSAYLRAGTTPFQGLQQYYVAWLAVLVVFGVSVLFWSYGTCMNERFNTLDQQWIEDGGQSQYHSQHTFASKPISGWLISLHPPVAARNPQSVIHTTLINDPLYDHRLLPRLIASYAF